MIFEDEQTGMRVRVTAAYDKQKTSQHPEVVFTTDAGQTCDWVTGPTDEPEVVRVNVGKSYPSILLRRAVL